MQEFEESENFYKYHEKARELVRECCSVQTLKSYFPVITWLPKYRLPFILNDILAGITVALLVIPQGLADASVTGLHPQYGLYSAFIGSFLYTILGTNKNVTVGVTAIMSVMIRTSIDHNADLAVLTTFISGCILLILSVFKLGVVARLISLPVVTAFLIASALSVIAAQINNIFGVKPSSGNFIHCLINFFSKIAEFQWRDTLLGISTFSFLIAARQLRNFNWRFKVVTKYLSFASNALAIVVGIMLCYFLRDGNWLPFSVSGKIASGLPTFKAPAFSTTLNGKTLNFAQMCAHLGPLLITIPLISVFECVVTLKSFSKGQIVNASQDLLVVSLSNIFGSFLGSLPVTSAFLRTAVNHATGVRSQLSGILTGTIVLLSLAFLTKTFYYIPKATLAAVNIAAMIPIIKVNVVLDIFCAKKLDMISFLMTLLISLFVSIQYGIIVGVLVDVICVLWRIARPKVKLIEEKILGAGILLVKIECHELDFAAAEYLNEKVIQYLTSQDENIQTVVIDGTHLRNIDTTIANSLLVLKGDLETYNCQLICWNWSRKTAGIVCRLKRSARPMFKSSNNWQAVFEESQTVTVIESVE